MFNEKMFDRIKKLYDVFKLFLKMISHTEENTARVWKAT